MVDPSIGAPRDSASSQSVTALVLGVLGLITCQLLGPFAWYLGNQELRAIRAGRSPAAGEGLALAGKILGIIATIILVIIPVFLFFFGGLAILTGLFAEGAS